MTGQSLVEQLLPRLAIPLPDEGGGRLDPASLFTDPKKDYWLEVGFGGGEHAAWQAEHHPDVGLIGAEVFLNGIASLLGHIERGGLDNIRIYPEDVRPFLARLKENSLSRVFVLFPDPWPKSRHVDRRFINDANLDLLVPLMKPGAILRIATDDETYKAHAREVMAARTDFEDVTGADPTHRPEDWPETRYNAKALREGRVPIFLSYRRR
ncbi:MAG TPA: tRNA (guanine(46)-N(7))-methyltransferase TrmB [Magnetospirillaceae bacterium]|nr:tRNA (guanine(46)-N(7))-methyltransferase TrmB [Magnetospirillaceae bacterium]